MPEAYKLLKSQKNEVFKLIEQTYLKPTDFSWSVDKGEGTCKRVPILNYLDGDYYFKFDWIIEEHHCVFSPGFEKAVEDEHPGNWSKQKDFVNLWLSCLIMETEASDLWAEVAKYKPVISLLPVEQLIDEPIPPHVVERIEAKLDLFSDEIKQQFKLNEGQHQVIKENMDFLKDEAKHQKCRSWALMLFAVLINIAYQYPDKLKQFWELVGRTVGQVKILLNP